MNYYPSCAPQTQPPQRDATVRVYEILGPNDCTDVDNRPSTVEAVGCAHFYERVGENGARQAYAARIDAVTVISPGWLEYAQRGDLIGIQVVDDRLVLEAQNGTWAYRIGEYDAHYRGIILRLVEGEPLTPS